MANRAVAAASRAISEKSAKTRIADRPTGTQAVVRTTHADTTTAGTAPGVVGESQQDAEHISPASADKKISENAGKDDAGLHPADQPPRKKPNQSEALKSNASKSRSLVRDTSVSGEYVSPEPQKPQEREVESISRATLSSPRTTMEHLHKMSKQDLSVLDALENEGRRIIKERLIVIWEEMSARFERGESVNGISGTGGKGMGKYLRSIGVDPAKRRSWKFEILKQDVRRLSQEKPAPKPNPKKKKIIITVQTEADRIAKAGVKIAQVLANDNKTPQEERFNKARPTSVFLGLADSAESSRFSTQGRSW